MATFRNGLVLVLALFAAPCALAQTGQQLFSQWCQGCHGPAGGNVNNVLAGKDWTFIRLAMDTRPQMTEVLRPAYDEGTITDDDLMRIATYLQSLGGSGATPVRPVVEYFNAAFGHYFVTADDDEITGLDAGAFDFAFIRTGLTGTDIGITYLLPRLIGASLAFDMILTGREVSAERAERIGLVSEIVPDAAAGALALARTVASYTQIGLVMTKEVMWNNLDASSIEACLAAENRNQGIAARSPEVQEFMRSYSASRVGKAEDRPVADLMGGLS